MRILGKTSLLSDQKLIEHYKSSQDQKFFAELFSRYTHLIMGVCLKYLKNKEASKDGVMNLYESLSDKLLTSEVNNFGGWLYVVTKNYCIGELRKQIKIDTEQNILVEHMEFELQERPLNEHSLEAQLTVLEKCIEILNKEQGTCVSLFYIKKKSYKEVTNLTGYTLKKVKSNIQNGKRNLKNCIESTLEKEN
jgi:RNA polymerase sigma-70 factor, ECF subfamily